MIDLIGDEKPRDEKMFHLHMQYFVKTLCDAQNQFTNAVRAFVPKKEVKK